MPNKKHPTIQLTFDEYGQLDMERTAIFMERHYGMKRRIAAPVYYRIMAAGIDPDDIGLWVNIDDERQLVTLGTGPMPKD